MYEERYEGNNHRPSGNRNSMAFAAAVFGVLSLLLCSVFYLSLPLGALAVLFAVLSRTGSRMTGKSKVGMACGICGMIATAVITVSSLHYILTDPAGRSYLEYYYRMYTGDYEFDIDKDLQTIFPFLGEPSEPTPEFVPRDDSDNESVPEDLPVTDGEGVFL